MNDINQKLDIIINKLDKLEERLNIIEGKQESISIGTDNMNNHINFINNVYDNVKRPLSYVTNKINNYIEYNN
jgi:hypothetical protein